MKYFSSINFPQKAAANSGTSTSWFWEKPCPSSLGYSV